jgi:hypothetical protein
VATAHDIGTGIAARIGVMRNITIITIMMGMIFTIIGGIDRSRISTMDANFTMHGC